MGVGDSSYQIYCRRLQNQQPVELKMKTLFPNEHNAKTLHSRFKKEKRESYKHVKAIWKISEALQENT